MHLKPLPWRINFINYPCCPSVDHGNNAQTTMRAKMQGVGEGGSEERTHTRRIILQMQNADGAPV